jgi:hypothetical protein
MITSAAFRLSDRNKRCTMVFIFGIEDGQSALDQACSD